MTSENVAKSYDQQLLEGALEYASMGLAVFPARVERPDPTSHSKTVQPAGPWRSISTTDPAQIERWWGESGTHRGHSVCVDVGKSGKVVIDLDDPEAVTFWDHYADEHGFGRGVVEHSPFNGGQHRWYEADDVPMTNGTKVLHSGVDVRAEGGFVIAAPSKDSAGAYRFDKPLTQARMDTIPAQMLNDRIREYKARKSPERGEFMPEDGGPTRIFTKEQAKAYLEPQLANLQHAQDGEINDTANATACALSHFVPHFLSVESAWKTFEAALSHTVYDSATWNHERFRRIIDGSERIADDWTAVRAGSIEMSMDAAEEAESSKKLSKRQEMEAKLLSSKGLATIKPPQWAIHGVLEYNSLNWIFGPPGGGKSFIALDLAAHFSKGLDWRGHRVTKPGRVLYLVAEGVSGFVLRVRAWEERHSGGQELDNVLFYPEPVQILQSMGREGLKSSEDFEIFCDIMTETVKPDMIILDTQARVSVGMDENSNTDAGVFVENMERLRRATGACVILVHHTPKDGTKTLRGASALDGAATTEILVHQTGKEGNRKVVVENVKQKNGEEFEDLEGVFVTVDVAKHVKDEHAPTTSAVVVDPSEAVQGVGVLSFDVSELTPAVESILADVERLVDEETTPYVKGISVNALRPMVKRPDGTGVSADILNQALGFLAHREVLESYAGPRNSKLWIRYGQAPDTGK